jgi:methylenetetrahydrofolate reductase (NADPH)
MEISFEFFPPKTTEGLNALKQQAFELKEVQPSFFSVTYGAGGSTQSKTAKTVQLVKKWTNIDCVPHISCIGSKKTTIVQLLDFYRQQGINQLVTLRGDIPSGMGASMGDFCYASDLVEFVRMHSGDYFNIRVAAHPEFHPQTNNAIDDLQHFIRKVNAGANSALTQYFYNSDAYFYFVDACEKHGVSIPIVPGIMPITNVASLKRFSSACGAELPRWLIKKLEAYNDDDKASISALAQEFVTKLCRRLIEGGAPGLHFYTLNKSNACLEILKNLHLVPASIEQLA